MRRLSRYLGIGALLVLFVFLVPLNALGQFTLTVWDNGPDYDDRAEVYLDKVFLGLTPEDPTQRGTWDLGTLLASKHELVIKHVSDSTPGNTQAYYMWNLSGGGMSVNNDTATTKPGLEVTVDVLANDVLTDASGTEETKVLELQESETFGIEAKDTLVVKSVTKPSKCTVEYNEKTVRYTANKDAYGKDTFQYDAFDPSNEKNKATATVTITILTDPPVAADYEIRLCRHVYPYGGDVTDKSTDPIGKGLIVSYCRYQNGGIVLTPNKDGDFIHNTVPPPSGHPTLGEQHVKPFHRSSLPS